MADSREIRDDTASRSRGFDAQLAALLSDLRSDDAASARRRRRSLDGQAAEDATLHGLLVECGELACEITMAVGETPVRGRVVGVGADFVAVESTSGLVLVHLDEIASVQPSVGAPRLRGDAPGGVEVRLAHLLGPLAADRPTVSLARADGTTVRGELRSCGADVALLVDGSRETWIPIAAIRSIRLH